MSSATCLSRSSSVTVFETDDPICALTRSETTEDKEEDMEILEESLVHGDWRYGKKPRVGACLNLFMGVTVGEALRQKAYNTSKYGKIQQKVFWTTKLMIQITYSARKQK